MVQHHKQHQQQGSKDTHAPLALGLQCWQYLALQQVVLQRQEDVTLKLQMFVTAMLAAFTVADACSSACAAIAGSKALQGLRLMLSASKVGAVQQQQQLPGGQCLVFVAAHVIDASARKVAVLGLLQ
jgi:hypothetical protein